MKKNVISRPQCERISDHALGYRITNFDPGGRYSIVKEVITDPHLPAFFSTPG